MSVEKLFTQIENLENEYLNFLIDVCNIESPTDYKTGVDAVGKYFIDKAEQKGWDVEVCKQEVSGDCVCITLNPNAKGQPVCFSGHMDTVHPVDLFPKNPTVIKDGIVYGPGVIDCKGGCVASFMAMDALQRIGYIDRPIKLILQSDEENGSRFSNKTTVDFMGEKAKGCIAFLNTEPHYNSRATVERKGIKKYGFEITGKSAHSGKCYDGISAIKDASYRIIELENLKDAKGITCNCGIISGGTAENTVPEKCAFTADFRYKTVEQGKWIDEFVVEFAKKTFVEGASCVATLKSWRFPMEKVQRNVELLEKINKIYQDIGLPVLEEVSNDGGADSADMTVKGIPCLDSFGTEGGKVHSEQEFMYANSLIKSAKRLASVAYCIK